MPAKRKKFSYLTPILLLLVFGLPPLAGWLYIANPQWLPDRHKNNGILISPPRPLGALVLRDAQDQPFDWQTLRGHWTLVSYNSGQCADACRQQLGRLQQIRRAVGAERIRVRQMLIQDHPGDTTSSVPRTGERQAFDVAYLEVDQQAAFDQLFALPDIESENATYLIDPNGMLMMAHDTGKPAKELLKDLELLLKASRNWATGVNNDNG